MVLVVVVVGMEVIIPANCPERIRICGDASLGDSIKYGRTIFDWSRRVERAAALTLLGGGGFDAQSQVHQPCRKRQEPFLKVFLLLIAELHFEKLKGTSQPRDQIQDKLILNEDAHIKHQKS